MNIITLTITLAALSPLAFLSQPSVDDSTSKVVTVEEHVTFRPSWEPTPTVDETFETLDKVPNRVIPPEPTLLLQHVPDPYLELYPYFNRK